MRRSSEPLLLAKATSIESAFAMHDYTVTQLIENQT